MPSDDWFCGCIQLLQRVEDVGNGLAGVVRGAGLKASLTTDEVPGYQALRHTLDSFLRAAERKPLIQMFMSPASDGDTAFKILNSYISSSSYFAETIQSIRQVCEL